MTLTRTISRQVVRSKIQNVNRERKRVDESNMGCDAAEIADLLTVSPGEEVRFPSDLPNARIPLTLNNINAGSVAFKVKTTSPEKFRVKPSSGVVSPGCHVTIELALCEGFSAQQIVSDKFLLLATPVSNDCLCSKDLAKLWKNLPNDQRFEHKLRCVLDSAKRDGMSVMIGMQIRDLSDKLECLQERLDVKQRLSERQWRAQSRRTRFGLLLGTLLLFVLSVDVLLALTGSRGHGAGYALCMVRKSALAAWTSWF
ncbi:motile sperm domain-containing protein 2-like [Pollicipes pollicipes]|uniref:motile sperm domain-containing protein 2-like n=1 Tax=Pollicipes pollicipes TaxID=41117 RepID=UPI0018857377|nr:motile sperm domain-containing protein 2-like [Pollicipes pollicipes]